MRYYSQTTGCCYVEGIHLVMPADAVEISEERYDAVIANPVAGKIRSHDESGLPILIDPPAASLDDIRAQKLAELDAACAAAIVLGFTSDALGEVHTYPSKGTDQANLTASFADALAALLAGEEDWTTPFWCMNSAGIWDMREHTAAQITAVGKTGKAIILAYQQKNIALQKKVLAATTAEEVAAISWTAET